MITAKSVTFEFELPHTGLTATGVVERVGQEPPCKGDGVVVSYTIDLPTDKSTSAVLADSLVFESRVRVMGACLYQQWEAQGPEVKGRVTSRRSTMTVHAMTWAEAERMATAELHAEINRLIVALEKRHNTLVAAEE